MTGNGYIEPDERTTLLPRARSHHRRHSSRLSRISTTTTADHPWLKNSRFWVRCPAQVANIVWVTLMSNYVHVLLVFVPLGIIAGALKWSPSAVFTLNFFAIMPLASLLSFATEELAAVMGQTLGGLMNATFGNAVELIVRSLQETLPSFNRGVPADSE